MSGSIDPSFPNGCNLCNICCRIVILPLRWVKAKLGIKP